MAIVQRRIREKEIRRQQILNAAREVFFENGFEKTTIEEIAKRTELSKGAIYLYFQSKEEIYITLMHEGSRILHDMLKAVAGLDLPADSLLRRLGRAYLEFYEIHRGYFRMLFLYSVFPDIEKKISPELCVSCERLANESLSLVAGVIEKGVKDGLFRPCNSMDFAVLVWTAQNGIILLGERGDKEFLKIDPTVEKLQDLFLESMISSLKAGR